MLDIIALIVLGFSALLFVITLMGSRKPKPKIPSIQMEQETKSPAPLSKEGHRKRSSAGPRETMLSEEEEVSDRMPSMARPSELAEESPRAAAPGIERRVGSGMGAAFDTINRKASLLYWERMSLEEEYDLFVTLHRPEFKVSVPEGATLHESDQVYQLPTTGHVRIVPVCSGCNISPAYRDIKVTSLADETRAQFKVLPINKGDYDLDVEFQIVKANGEIEHLGKETAQVHIQSKPIELNLGALNISVGRKVPAFFSFCGSFFGLTSFILARLGINLNEEIFAWSATVSTSLAGLVMILIVLMLVIKGLKPLMNEIDISLK